MKEILQLDGNAKSSEGPGTKDSLPKSSCLETQTIYEQMFNKDLPDENGISSNILAASEDLVVQSLTKMDKEASKNNGSDSSHP